MSTDAPFSSNGSEDGGARQKPGCTAEIPAGADACPKCGLVQLRNQRARKYPIEHPEDVLSAADAEHAGMVSDQGGDQAMSTLLRSAVRKLRDLEVLLTQNARIVVKAGLHSKEGDRAHDRYLAALDRWMRLADKEGFDRKQRSNASMSAEQYAAYQRAQQTE